MNIEKQLNKWGYISPSIEYELNFNSANIEETDEEYARCIVNLRKYGKTKCYDKNVLPRLMTMYELCIIPTREYYLLSVKSVINENLKER